MASVSATVSIPLNDRAVMVSKRMALNSAGVGSYSLDNMIDRQVDDSTRKAAATVNLNRQKQQEIDQLSMGSAPRREQAGDFSVTA